ncbi:MAG: M20/M25/M40 family metallo-hydrolase [Candidatus Lambdaproteobacteria bacterium]|nr:M20/M25/M40 family metallo-hydrolase [Candidatus Lambdaproteobacteria bacterium]
MEAVEYLLAEGFRPDRTVYLAFGHDEEVGGAMGAAFIAAKLGARGVRLEFTLDEGLVIAEGILPGIAAPVALIGLAEKGKVTLELTASGACGHSSTPPPHSAVGKLGRALFRLEESPMPRALTGPVAAMFAALAHRLPFASRLAIANRWLLMPMLLSRLERAPATNALIRTTIAPTMIRGGIKDNQVPCSALAVVDVRILPGDSVESVIRHVRRAVADDEVVVRMTGSDPSEPSPISNIGSPSYASLRRTVQEVFPDVVVAPSLVIGRTDSRNYAAISDNSYRFLPVRLAKADLGRIHGTDERVSSANYTEVIRFYIQLLRNSARP